MGRLVSSVSPGALVRSMWVVFHVRAQAYFGTLLLRSVRVLVGEKEGPVESHTQVAKRLAERLGGPACHYLSFRKKCREFSQFESVEDVYSLVVVNFALLT